VTGRKREPTEEERALFSETFRDVRPARKQAKAPKSKSQSEPTLTPRVKASPAPAREHHAGLDGRTAERLRKGQLEPEDRLDLHGMTETVAHRSLAQFLRSAHLRNLRLVLVVTGKGSRDRDPDAPFTLELDRRARGVLNTMTPRWLASSDLAPLIATVRTAHRKHGGAGALYIYLRKAKR
jgi:DNA-nicking Smr family endonuclease